MTWLRKQRPQNAPAPAPIADPCLGDPEARRLRDALENREWSAARAVLAAAEHPDDRAFYLDVCATVTGLQAWIGYHAADDELAQLVRGAHAAHWAWAARGGYRAEYTSQDQFEVFFERLRLAESCLYDVVRRNPDEVSAWAFLVRTARGLQLPLDDGEFRYRQAVERSPSHWKASYEWMQTLCKKWFGSHQQMHRFAREAATRSLDGSMVHALVALSHLEVTLDLEEFHTIAYMTQPSVRAELRTAAEHSIWHPSADLRPGSAGPLNIFAMAFSLSADPAAASAVFRQLGDRPTPVIWGYLGGDPLQRFLAARSRVTAS